MQTKLKTYKVGLVDADLLCNGTRHPNLALLKIAGYFRDNGFVRKVANRLIPENASTYELLTNESNFEKLQQLEHIYVSCVFSFTLDDPPLLLSVLMSDKKLKKRVHMGGTGRYANLSVEDGFSENQKLIFQTDVIDKFLTGNKDIILSIKTFFNYEDWQIELIAEPESVVPLPMLIIRKKRKVTLFLERIISIFCKR